MIKTRELQTFYILNLILNTQPPTVNDKAPERMPELSRAEQNRTAGRSKTVPLGVHPALSAARRRHPRCANWRLTGPALARRQRPAGCP